MPASHLVGGGEATGLGGPLRLDFWGKRHIGPLWPGASPHPVSLSWRSAHPNASLPLWLAFRVSRGVGGGGRAEFTQIDPTPHGLLAALGSDQPRLARARAQLWPGCRAETVGTVWGQTSWLRESLLTLWGPFPLGLNFPICSEGKLNPRISISQHGSEGQMKAHV